MKITDKQRITHAKVLKIIERRTKLLAMKSVEKISLKNCLGRIIATNIKAPHPIPLHTNAAVDGYAFAIADVKKQLPIHCSIAAGDLTNYILPKQTAARIFTGAKLPKNAETIIMQEDAIFKNNKLVITTKIKKGANCRKSGEDVKKNETIIKKHKRISAADIASIASLGINKISVFKKPKILLLASGNELKNIYANKKKLKQGEVWDSNSPMLYSLLQKLPVEITLGEIVKDDFLATCNLIKNASKKYNMILTTGGASFGNQDFMLDVLKKYGRCHLWQVAIKPGRPMMLGEIKSEIKATKNNCLFFALPGNPVAAYVCFLLYTRHAILKLCGADITPPPRFQLPALFEIKNKKLHRREFLRGKLVQQKNTLAVQKFNSTGSGLISSLRFSDGLIEISENVSNIKKGQNVNFIPYSAFE